MSIELIPVVDFVLKIFSGISDLAKGRSNRKKDFLENHIEPLQDRLMDIHQEYIRGFQEVRRLIKDNSKAPDEIIEFLLQRRRDYDSQRQLVHYLAIEIEKARKLTIEKKLLEAVSNYCNSIVEYLNEGTSPAAMSWYSRFIEHVGALSQFMESDVWRHPGISGKPRESLLETIDVMLDIRLPKAFDEVLAKYAALRAQLL